jgi:predicted GTPase
LKPVLALVGRPNVGKSTLFNRLTKSRDAIVADFVRRYSTGEDIEYSSDYTPIMDALGIWNDAIRWRMINEKV